MNIRYFIECKTGKLDGQYHFYPIGVWVKGPGPGFDIKFAFLKGHEEQQERAEITVIRAVAAGQTGFADGYMEYHQQGLNGYNGDRGPIIETDVYDFLMSVLMLFLGRFSSTTRKTHPTTRLFVTPYTDLAIQRFSHFCCDILHQSVLPFLVSKTGCSSKW